MDFKRYLLALKLFFSKEFERFKKFRKEIILFSVASIVVGLVKLILWLVEPTPRTFYTETRHTFEGGRVIEDKRGVGEVTEKALSMRLTNVEKGQKSLQENLERIGQKINDLGVIKEPKTQQIQEAELPAQTIPFNTTRISPSVGYPHVRSLTPNDRGPTVISFPVDSKNVSNNIGVNLPSGSFVKAKLLTGVEAPEGKPLPVLLQADYAFIGPNKTRIDLSGCFLIAKSTGNLSIERVEMQATKISCVSKMGQMFERDINGFVADDKDNSFAVMGSVNSKQDRVAAMAFLSSVVEGIGKAVQQAQTTTQMNPQGVSTSTVTGEEGRYIAAGGAATAASMVTQWYLKQAQSLLPTINVGSGQDVWIIMQDGVELPNWYFKKKNNTATIQTYEYLSRVVD